MNASRIGINACITLGLAWCGSLALAADQPQQKPGLWRRTSQTTEDGTTNPPQTLQRCMDASALEKAKVAAANAAKSCSKHDLRLAGGAWTEDSICTLEGSTMTVHAETRMSGDTKYHTESDTTYSPAFYGSTHSHVVADGVWLGECDGQ